MLQTIPLAARTRAGVALAALLTWVAGGPSARPGLAQEKHPQFTVRDTAQSSEPARMVHQTRKEKPSILWLRPNTEGAFFLFVENPAGEDKTCVVRLRDGEGKELAKSDEFNVAAAGKAVLVRLPQPAPPKKPAADEVPPKAPAPKGAAAGWLEGKGLAPQFTFELLEVSAGKQPAADAVPVDRLATGIFLPHRYLKPALAYDATKHRLSVTVTADEDFFGGECPVRMLLQFRDPQTCNWKEFLPAEGRLLGSVSAEKKAIELFAEDPDFAKAGATEGMVTISADDYPRAFRFQIDRSAKGGVTTVSESKAAEVWLDSPKYSAPAARVPVLVGLDNLSGLAFPRSDAGGAKPPERSPFEDDVILQLDFGRRQAKGFEVYHTEWLSGHRDERVFFQLSGAGGAVAYSTEVRDWKREVPAQGAYGKDALRVRVLRKGSEAQPLEVKNSESKQDPAAYVPIVLDAGRPTILPDRPVGTRVTRGESLRVEVRVKAPPSGIKSVVFYAAKAIPDPKVPGSFLIPEGAPRAEGKRHKDGPELPACAEGDRKEEKESPETWEAVLAQVPTDKKGTIEITVEAVSNVGLKDLGRFEVVLVEPGAAPSAVSIRGKVSEGGRPQAKQLVILKDVQGGVKADATTNDAGEYEFRDLPPGPYVVSAVKKKSMTKGETTVQVKSGKEATADIDLLR